MAAPTLSRCDRAAARVRPWLPSPRRAVGGTILLALSLLLVTAGWAGQGSAETAPVPLQLKGEGSWGPYKEVVTWQDDLYGAKSPVDLAYTTTASYQGRQDFLAGGLDYVISGVPFTADELEQVKGGAAGLIDVPIQVETMSMLLAIPQPEGFETVTYPCDPYDPDVPDPDACIVKKAYTGPVRIPNRNMAAMLFKYPGPGQMPMTSWNDPDVLAAMGVDNFTLEPLAGPAPIVRSEASASNYFMQLYVKTVAPDVWSGLEALHPDATWEPLTERLPKVLTASRQGVDQQVLQLGLGADPASGSVSGFSKGIVAPVPPSAKDEVEEAFPNTQLTDIELQNASKEWVAPTPASIDKAVAAGGDTPFYALTNPAPGAYPLVWVNHLYAPATGLTPEKTEALATTIRYLATDGQKAGEPWGEGQLSAALVAKALKGADALVTSNCVGSDRRTVKSAEPGTYAPDLPGVEAVGEVLHCERVGAAPTTTTSTTTPVPYDTTPYVDPGTSYDPGFGDLPADTGTGPDAGVTDTTAPAASTTAPAKTTTTAPGTTAPPAAALPMAVPSGKPEGYDQMAALLMGGSLPLMFGSGIKRLFLGLFL
ncbi:hypothetical protein [Aquihabitans sp. McL0605]|uniref:hypothetical protein n=1 Tax=Aquihabitans sp. McL0605 TaxID=3415671 RepID=UPI003CE93EFA